MWNHFFSVGILSPTCKRTTTPEKNLCFSVVELFLKVKLELCLMQIPLCRICFWVLSIEKKGFGNTACNIYKGRDSNPVGNIWTRLLFWKMFLRHCVWNADVHFHAGDCTSKGSCGLTLVQQHQESSLNLGLCKRAKDKTGGILRRRNRNYIYNIQRTMYSIHGIVYNV